MGKYRASSFALILGVLGAPCGLTAQQTMAAPSSTGTAPTSNTIHQEIDFAVSPMRVYEALLNDTLFAAFSSAPATIDREAGGAFSLFGGAIVGRNVELVPNQRIVQAWRAASWPEGVYSIVRFELQARGTGTHLVFDHAGFPQDQRDHLAAGWEAHYWARLNAYFR